jgi:hypothetical protein
MNVTGTIVGFSCLAAVRFRVRQRYTLLHRVHNTKPDPHLEAR